MRKKLIKYSMIVIMLGICGLYTYRFLINDFTSMKKITNHTEQTSGEAVNYQTASPDEIKKTDIGWERIKLSAYDKKKVKKYSLGMRQKIGIIAALMENSKLVLLDEPTNALDSNSITVLNELLFEQKKKGSVIIITSHDFEELRLVADEIYEMESGKLKQRREPDEEN